jgi:hypothetical protein
MPNSTAVTPAQAPAAQAAKRTLNIRRVRAWRQLLLFLLASVGFTLIVLANRDHQSVRNCQQRVQEIARQLQTRQDRGEALPAGLPLPGNLEENLAVHDPVLEVRSVVRDHYIYRPMASKSEAVCGCLHVHKLWLRTDGRHVIVYNAASSKYEVAWLTSAEFAKQGSALGLVAPQAPRR